MKFIWAIRSGFKNYFVFTGTATRPEYWYWFLFNILLAVIGYLVSEWLALWAVQVIALFLPTLTVTVRRLRDAGYSWAWLLLKVPAIIPFLIGAAFYYGAIFRLGLGAGFSILAGDVDEANTQLSLARDELIAGFWTMVLSMLYMAGSFLLVWGFFTTRKSKSFEEGNKRVAPKNPENPAV
jgi:uncharacterized membrane protein YhaH (DUF805 family)